MLSGCVLWLRADLGITTVDAAVADPNDLSTGSWTPANLSARTATTITDDGVAGAHQIYQAVPSLQNNHEAAFRVDVPLVGGTGRYVFFFVSAGSHYVALDTSGAGSIVGTNIVPTPTYVAGVLQFTHLVTNSGVFVRTSPDGVTHTYAGTGRTAQIGPGTAGHDAIEVTQRNVSAWADQSGNGNHFAQATGADQPLFAAGAYNGQPCVRGGDTSDHLEHATSVSLGTAATLFVVMKQGSLSNNYVTADAAGANGLISRFTPGLVEWFNGSGADRYTFASSPGGANIYTLRQTNGSALQGWVNGTSAFGPVVPAAALTNIKSLLALYTGTNGSANQDLLEVIAYTNSKGDSERQLVERKLGARYGIAVA